MFVRIQPPTKVCKEVKSIQSQNLTLGYVNTISQKLMEFKKTDTDAVFMQK